MRGGIRGAGLVMATLVLAQVADAGYEEIRVCASASRDLASGRFQDLWRLSPVIRLEAETPTRIGRLGLFVWGGRADARRVDLPDLLVGGLGAAWWGERALGRARLALGGAFGTQVMHVVRGPSRGRAETESEYVADAALRVRVPVPLGEAVDVAGEVRRRVVLTGDPIHETHLSLGIAVSFETPPWLRSILE